MQEDGYTEFWPRIDLIEDDGADEIPLLRLYAL